MNQLNHLNQYNQFNQLNQSTKFMYSLSTYDYHLPEELIAQKPLAQRDYSRLLLLNRKTGDLSHRKFGELPEFISPRDILVVNNTEVIPGRLRGRKDTGGKIEVLILDYAGATESHGEFICTCLIKASKPSRTGARLYFNQQLEAEVLDLQQGIYTLKFSYQGRFQDLLYQIGRVPLPPYIKRSQDADDQSSYQTVYASAKGAVAAPTAGFHFTETLIKRIKSKGARIVSVTLHIGYGTFLPVRVSDIRDHCMHSERFTIPEVTADAINKAKAEGKRIVAVGTTSVRTLEFASDANGKLAKGGGSCDLFIYPGYKFKVVDAMITNFHLPKSTLLMLVSAFAGRESILQAYEEAIEKRYRFYSYGDAMFII
jgi:S-adenosylmethionine:tRNA ribosyltransferase-isomerase